MINHRERQSLKNGRVPLMVPSYKGGLYKKHLEKIAALIFYQRLRVKQSSVGDCSPKIVLFKSRASTSILYIH